MEVQFLKDHDKYKAGDKEDLPEGLGNYLVSVHVAKEVNKDVPLAEPDSDPAPIEDAVTDKEKVEGVKPVSKKDIKKGKEKKEK